jgi:hypothetical protein
MTIRAPSTAAWMLAAWLASTSVALADSGLPFRFEALHWGMGQSDVVAQFPQFAPRPAGQIGVATKQLELETTNYRWKLCRLDVSVYFVDGQLNALSIVQGYPTTDDGCARSVLYELKVAFGEGRARPDATVGGQKVTGRDWCNAETVASYNDMEALGVEADLQRRSGSPVIDPSLVKPVQCP